MASNTKQTKEALKALLNRLKTGSESGGEVVKRGGIASIPSQRMANLIGETKGASAILKKMDMSLQKAYDVFIEGYLRAGDALIDSPENSLLPSDYKVFEHISKDMKIQEKAFKDAAKKQLREDLKFGIGSKGRMLEFKMFLLSGNIKDFNASDNLAAYAGGDLDILAPPEITGFKDFRIISAQAKAANSSFTMAKDTTLGYQKKLFEELLESFAQKYGSKYIDDARLRSNFEKTIAKLSETVAYSDQIKQILDEKDQRTAFFARYLELSASQYYVLGMTADADLLTAIPHDRFLDFIDKHGPEEFKINSKGDSLVSYSYKGTFGRKGKALNTLLLTNDKYKFHVHMLRGLGEFIAMRDKAFGYEPGTPREEQSNSYKQNILEHRGFLKRSFSEFNIPHTQFFGGDDYSDIVSKY